MLTLERKEGETIIVNHEGETLKINVSLVRDNKVKLSFDGTEKFEVWRDEVGKS